jgi:Zn-dependent oligopeptidase
MGHAFHGLCSKTQFAKFHGTAVARDFVEAPSQALENWMFESAVSSPRDVRKEVTGTLTSHIPAKVLRELSSHYKDKSKLDDEVIASIIKSKHVNEGLFNLR